MPQSTESYGSLSEKKTLETDFEGHFNKGIDMRRTFQAEGTTYARAQSNKIGVLLEITQGRENKVWRYLTGPMHNRV